MSILAKNSIHFQNKYFSAAIFSPIAFATSLIASSRSVVLMRLSWGCPFLFIYIYLPHWSCWDTFTIRFSDRVLCLIYAMKVKGCGYPLCFSCLGSISVMLNSLASGFTYIYICFQNQSSTWYSCEWKFKLKKCVDFTEECDCEKNNKNETRLADFVLPIIDD